MLQGKVCLAISEEAISACWTPRCDVKCLLMTFGAALGSASLGADPLDQCMKEDALMSIFDSHRACKSLISVIAHQCDM
jgi:hypothetical protein